MAAAATGAKRGQQRLQVRCLRSRSKRGCTVDPGKVCCELFMLDMDKLKTQELSHFPGICGAALTLPQLVLVTGSAAQRLAPGTPGYQHG